MTQTRSRLPGIRKNDSSVSPPRQTQQRFGLAKRQGTKGHQTRTNLHKDSNQPLITTNVINHLKEELLTTWETYLIPDYHRTVFLDCIYGLTPQQYGHIFVKEIEDL